MLRKYYKHFDKISNKFRIFFLFLKKIFVTFPYHFAEVTYTLIIFSKSFKKFLSSLKKSLREIMRK